MRIILAILIAVTFLPAKAQSHLPAGGWGYGYSPWQPASLFTLPANGITGQKWQLRPYTALSAGYIFLNGGISYLSAPLGLTLFHPLTSNVTAFAGVSATPVVFSVANLYAAPFGNPAYPGYNFPAGYGMGINAAVQGGLMYTNDAHTFSISGSVIMQRGGYPVYPSARRTDDSKH
jgi:hypothetical protein